MFRLESFVGKRGRCECYDERVENLRALLAEEMLFSVQKEHEPWERVREIGPMSLRLQKRGTGGEGGGHRK